MPSSLTGLLRTLTWTDFPHRQGHAPSPGHHATAALTASSYNTTGVSVQPTAGSRPPQYRVVDNLTVNVTFDRGQSYVMSWLFSQPAQFQTDMLNHEQGHYNITALVSRDYFVDVMLLKSQVFANAHAGVTAARHIQHHSVDKLQRIQDLYDREVHPEQNAGKSCGPIQQNWNRFIQTAFTQARSPATQSPSGVPHKVRLIDVLNQSGKQI